MNIRFAPEIGDMLKCCRLEAMRFYNDKITPAHIMLAILQSNKNETMKVLHQLNADINGLRDNLERLVRQNVASSPFTEEDLELNIDASRVMKLSVLESRLAKSESVNLEHVLLGLLRDESNEVSRLLSKQNITYESLRDEMFPITDDDDEEDEAEDVKDVKDVKKLPKAGYGLDNDDEEEEEMDDERIIPLVRIEKRGGSKNESKTPVLDNFGTDLTKAAAEGLLDPVVGRAKEIERVAQILSRRKKNNPILIGEPGVGKSAIVEGLAQRIVSHKISRKLWDKRLMVLDMASVVAGTKYRGQFEERMRAIILELQKNPDIIIFIDEIHTLIGAGSTPGSMDAANMLKPALSRGEIQCIGATTLDEYRKSIEKDGALERRFQKIIVPSTTPEETLEILKNLRGRYEEHHNVKYTDEALEACVSLTQRYVTDRQFPDKAIDAMDEAGSRMHIEDVPMPQHLLDLEETVKRLTQQKNEAVKAQNYELAADFRDQLNQAQKALEQEQSDWENSLKDNPKTIDADMIAHVVSMMTGIPVQRVGQEENERLRNMKTTLQKAIIGQDEAIATTVRAIQRSRIGLKDPNRPIGTFLFVGPTGVGKTFLAKKLAEEMFGTPDALIRIDMSEYMEKHEISRMVGSPPGYVGYDEGGQLTERVRRKPYSIVLLDEIEKAHQDVFNLLLQVLDEGRLTDGNGNTIDFRNTIVIMTSNCGTRQLREFGHGVGFQTTGNGTSDRNMARSVVQKSLQKKFAPEFLNRLDDIVYFDQLSQEHIHQIVDVEMKPLLARIEQLGYSLQLTEAAKELLSKKGYDVQYGARPLKRAIQTHIEDPLCQLMLEATETSGKDIVVDAEGEEIKLKIKE